jgi:rhamnose transport system permease protein
MNGVMKNREVWLAVVIAAMVAAITLRSPGFASLTNLRQIFNDTSILIILALGQMSVILTRSIDLSMAANLCFTGMVVAMLNAAHSPHRGHTRHTHHLSRRHLCDFRRRLGQRR